MAYMYTLADLLDAYDKWETEREALSLQEEETGYANWADSDDGGIEILHGIVGLLRPEPVEPLEYAPLCGCGARHTDHTDDEER